MLRFFKYRLDFKSPFQVFGNELHFREGIILVYSDGNITAYGEAAPLPGFSAETLEQVQNVLEFNRDILHKSLQNNTAEQVIEVLDQLHDFPSISFGVDTLIHDLAAKKSGKSLAEYLFPGRKHSLTANATLPFGGKEEVLKQAEEIHEKGFHTLKIKVGRNFEEEADLLHEIRRIYPQMRLRIDANQAWDVEEAIHNLNSLESLIIEYCEQPLSRENIAGLRKVKKSTTIQIAADESVRNKNDAFQLLKSDAVDILILKPTLIGLYKNLFVTKRMADSHNIKVVFTTSLESAIARITTAVLGSGLGSPEFAHGVNTGNFFKKDIGTYNWADKNFIQFPDKPGIGITVDLKSLVEV